MLSARLSVTCMLSDLAIESSDNSSKILLVFFNKTCPLSVVVDYIYQKQFNRRMS